MYTKALLKMTLILPIQRLFPHVLRNASSAAFWLQKDFYHICQPLKIDDTCTNRDADHTTQNQKQKSGNQGPNTEQTEEDVKHKILQASLEFVTSHGWTSRALFEGAKAEGYSAVADGMFPRGPGDLLHHFVRECNSELVRKLAAQRQEMEEDDGKKPKKMHRFIRDALETRLRMITPYVDSWPQAMALTVLPSNTLEHFGNVSKLMDDIWYYAGDRSTDFNWYTKRLSTAVIYKSTELHLVQDDSPDFQETWLFLDRRLVDAATFGRLGSDMDNALGTIRDVASAAITTGQNMIGMNERR